MELPFGAFAGPSVTLGAVHGAPAELPGDDLHPGFDGRDQTTSTN